MNDKQIINQLNKLAKRQPDSVWKAKNRELLLNQIGLNPQDNSAAVETGFSIFKLPIRLVKTIPQPVMAVFLIVLFMFGSGVLSIKASKNAKPGDSLYIAKIINEKTQLALTFDERKKAQLGIEFAGNRAKELSQILADTSGANDVSQKAKVDDLVNNFKKEINGVKNRIAKISSQSIERPAEDSKNGSEAKAEGEASEDNKTMFSANLGKDEQGIELSEPEADRTEIVNKYEKPALATATKETAQTATPTPEISANASSSQEIQALVNSSSDTQKILEQAGLLLKNEEYDATISKLNEAGEAMGLAGAGQVKGESESASTTESMEAENGEVLGAGDSEEASSTMEK